MWSIVWPITEAIFNSQLPWSIRLVPLADWEVCTQFWKSPIWLREMACTRKMTRLLRQSAMLSCNVGSSAATHSESCASPGLWRQGWICGLTRIRKSSSTASEHLAHFGHLSIWASASSWQWLMYRMNKRKAISWIWLGQEDEETS